MSDKEAKKKSSQALRDGQVDIRKRLYAVEAEGGLVEMTRQYSSESYFRYSLHILQTLCGGGGIQTNLGDDAMELFGLAQVQPPRDKNRLHDGSLVSNSPHSWHSIDPDPYRESSPEEPRCNALEPADWEALIGSLEQEATIPSSQHGAEEHEPDMSSITGLAVKLDRVSTGELAGERQLAMKGDMRVTSSDWPCDLGHETAITSDPDPIILEQEDDCTVEPDDVKLSSNEDDLPTRASPPTPASQGFGADGITLDPVPISFPSRRLRESDAQSLVALCACEELQDDPVSEMDSRTGNQEMTSNFLINS